MKPKTIAILGVGDRGKMFGNAIQLYSHLAKVVAVAEPRQAYREDFAREYALDPAMVFTDWREFISKPKMCDAVVISTMDQDHVTPAVACLKLGYDLMLEKPMATTLEDCRAIEAAQRASNGGIVAVCHSLRYVKNMRTLRDMVVSGAIGRVMTVDQLEPVGLFHQAHSFVRGNWGNEGRSTFMLLAKSCHDIDYTSYLVNQPCLSVMSYGHLSFFTRANAPAGSGERCTACAIEPTCEFTAIKQYVQGDRTQWPAAIVSADHSYEAHLQAIKTGPYGRCVWKCDNDVVDHQVVAMQFADDITVTFTMTGFSHGLGRQIRVHGTKGELRLVNEQLTMYTFATGDTQTITFGEEAGSHGGGDQRVVREWLLALHSRDDSQIVANAQESLKTHTIVFAAEQSRRQGRVVKIAEM
ncbi:MAG: Gfo/Idh/MocA family oxidoreductase [Phycisphaerales bacterium]|nr:Gfo/Idh/MocA family oxidoreductase [Phycisphaerales bacterium]